MTKQTIRIALAIIVGGLAIYGYLLETPGFGSGGAQQTIDSDTILARAFENRQSDLQVEGTGTVQRLLRDDTDGSRHQNFILALESGQTLLVAHNIDLARRINTLRVGDKVQFAGEYEWNANGGVVHWTHHDPAGRHAGGWLKHQGITYQ